MLLLKGIKQKISGMDAAENSRRKKL